MRWSVYDGKPREGRRRSVIRFAWYPVRAWVRTNNNPNVIIRHQMWVWLELFTSHEIYRACPVGFGAAMAWFYEEKEVG